MCWNVHGATLGVRMLLLHFDVQWGIPATDSLLLLAPAAVALHPVRVVPLSRPTPGHVAHDL